MNGLTEVRLIWLAGAIQVGIVLVNGILPQRLAVRQKLAEVPTFLRQIVYVHWMYIVLGVGFFGSLCFGFAHELAGGSSLGRFLSAFMGAFWLLRAVLQLFYYDKDLRRANRGLDALYLASLLTLSFIFGWAVFAPAA
jgi:hypothetical protein